MRPLYNRDKLESMCRSMHIPVTPICEKRGEPSPEYTQPLYHGKLAAVPGTTSAIGKFTIQKL